MGVTKITDTADEILIAPIAGLPGDTTVQEALSSLAGAGPATAEPQLLTVGLEEIYVQRAGTPYNTLQEVVI